MAEKRARENDEEIDIRANKFGKSHPVALKRQIEHEEEQLRKRVATAALMQGSHGGKSPRLPPGPPRLGSVKQPGMKRHRKVLRDNINGITRQDIRRLARRGGVKRMSGLIHEEARSVLKHWLEDVIKGAVIYTEHANRKTVTTMDVVLSLKKQQGKSAIHLYGYA
jgi:histone H4